jgi:hypothetical protein
MFLLTSTVNGRNIHYTDHQQVWFVTTKRIFMGGVNEFNNTHGNEFLYRLRRSSSGSYCNSNTSNDNLGTFSVVAHALLLLLDRSQSTLTSCGCFLSL